MAVDLLEATLDRIMATLFLDDSAPVRSRSAFEARLEEKRSDLVQTANQVVQTLQQVFAQWKLVQAAISKAKGGSMAVQLMLDPVRQHLAALCYPGFVQLTPYARLREFPRYLKAVLYRLERLPLDTGRDQRLQKEIDTCWLVYWTYVSDGRLKLPPEHDDFRWSLEELRVSLFAQQLKTAYPVSLKRLEEAWRLRLK